MNQKMHRMNGCFRCLLCFIHSVPQQEGFLFCLIWQSELLFCLLSFPYSCCFMRRSCSDKVICRLLTSRLVTATTEQFRKAAIHCRIVRLCLVQKMCRRWHWSIGSSAMVLLSTPRCDYSNWQLLLRFRREGSSDRDVSRRSFVLTDCTKQFVWVPGSRCFLLDNGKNKFVLAEELAECRKAQGELLQIPA